uniref:Uncharacterized protein n=1 Tax=Solanum lycopersicum TaxID=4081 RepID=A0A3Q7JB53_SOLLC
MRKNRPENGKPSHASRFLLRFVRSQAWQQAFSSLSSSHRLCSAAPEKGSSRIMLSLCSVVSLSSTS